MKFTIINPNPDVIFTVNGQTVYHFNVTGIIAGTGGSGAGILSVYTHTQSVPSATWIIAHNLGKLYPDITVLNSAGDEILGGQRVPIDNNNLTINYGAAFGGIAYLQ